MRLLTKNLKPWYQIPLLTNGWEYFLGVEFSPSDIDNPVNGGIEVSLAA